MAIQNRRGSYEDFNPNELLAGELAVVQDGDPASSTGRAIYICFEPGVVKRLVDYDDIGDEIGEAAGIYIDDMREVVTNAQTATNAANTATNDANTAAEAARQVAAGDVSNKTVTFSTPSSPSSLASGDSLATLIGKLQAYINNRSYVGMIIHSTTLDTQAKVKAQYGGTTWIRHSGYFLYGATSGVTASTENDLHNTADGGETTHTLTVNEMPSHSHSVSSGWADLAGTDRIVYSAKNGEYNDYGLGNVQFIQSTGGGAEHNNMPPYKNVYIWERIA